MPQKKKEATAKQDRRAFDRHTELIATTSGRAAGKESAHEVFRLLGIPIDDDKKIEEFRRNQYFLTDFRKGVRTLELKGWGAMLLAAGALLVSWIKGGS